MRWLDSVNFSGLTGPMVMAAIRADEVYAKFGYEMWITSANDATHMPESRHYNGNALDLRTKNVDASILPSLHVTLEKCLGPQFDVVLESDHIHVEFDPRS